MKIATFNVNGVNGRLPRLVEWLGEAAPDVACLQEIKTDDTKFPAKKLEAAGYRAVWHGQRAHHGVAILAKSAAPRELRRGLPGDDEDREARYLEAEVDGLVVASVYLPNGNPAPGPRFDYKLAWFERLIGHAGTLLESGKPTVLAGDFNVVPTKADIYNAWLWRFDAVIQPGDARRLGPVARARLDRRDAASASGRARLHLLGQRRGVPPARGISHGLPAARSAARRQAAASGGRCGGARAREGERPCAGVGRARRTDAWFMTVEASPFPGTWATVPANRSALAACAISRCAAPSAGPATRRDI